MDISCVDLFCGAGGLTYGLKKSGVSVIAGLDIDPACRYPYECNNGALFIRKDIRELRGRDLCDLFPKGTVRLIAGCAPCQPFSTLSGGRDTTGDEKWGLLYQFGRIIEETVPEIVTMENVPRLKNHSVYEDFVETLRRLDYFVSVQIVNGPDYGIPQTRKRLVILASRLGPIHLRKATHSPARYKTVRDIIGRLEPLAAGEIARKDPLHRARTLSARNLERVKNSKPGGTWEDWPEELRADCHKTERGSTYKSVYARMEWDRPSPTITTQCFNFGTGRFGHPQQDRGISLREAAMLQTFPKKYRFVEPNTDVSFSSVGRLIGNAVPPRLGEVIGMSIRDHLKETKDADRNPSGKLNSIRARGSRSSKSL